MDWINSLALSRKAIIPAIILNAVMLVFVHYNRPTLALISGFVGLYFSLGVLLHVVAGWE